MARDLKICVIGAGLSGLCAAKHLTQKGFKRITIFEATPRLGGTWNYEPNRNYPNAMYKNLTTNLPHKLMQYPDLPFPATLTDKKYPHHSVVLKYIKHYAHHFNLHSIIKYNHKIIKLIPPQHTRSLNSNDLPKWTVYIESQTRNQVTIHKDEFDSVIVCNGHYTKPYIPSFVGFHKFRKRVIHSRYYREPQHELFDNKVIVIVGYKSSGVDIGIEIFFECNNVRLYQVTHGKEVTKQINHKYFVDDDRFIYKQNISQFGDHSSVEFDDNDIIYPDIVIFCTGYEYDFEPFLSNNALKGFKFGESVDGLYQQLIYPQIPSLFFVCLSLTVVPSLIAHAQSQWIANILSDLQYIKNGNNCFEYRSKYLQSKEYMTQWINKHRQNSGDKKQFVLGLKQFEYIKQLCILAKEPVPSNLDELKCMYANRRKPMPFLNSNL